MCEFNSLDDWPHVDAELRRNIRALYNFGHKLALFKFLENLQQRVTELSQAEITLRRTGNNREYLAKLATVQEELAHLQQQLMFATLLDEKPER
jgi:hypothetical protein